MTSLSAARADDVSTKREAGALLLRAGSARVFATGAVFAGICRVLIADLSRADFAVVLVGLVVVGPVEWFLHRHALHAADEAWARRRLGTGVGHRRHHEDPPDLAWLLLSGRDAVLVLIVLGAFAMTWAVPIGVVLGPSVLGPALTAAALVALAFLHYEWAHLLFHTRYRCRTRFYRRLAANHRRHHFRNEGYWLGVTTNSGDRLLRTLPRRPADVPISPTARQLGASD